MTRFAMLAWLKWLLWDSRRCRHEPGPWQMLGLGMTKVRHCVRCGKCLDVV